MGVSMSRKPEDSYEMCVCERCGGTFYVNPDDVYMKRRLMFQDDNGSNYALIHKLNCPYCGSESLKKPWDVIGV